MKTCRDWKTCEDCLHYKICKSDGMLLPDFVECNFFNDRSEWVHLPCKVGDTVYFITGTHNRLIKSAVILDIIIDEDGIKDVYVKEENTHCFEHSFDIFYTTYEEAEKALERMKENGISKEM